MKAISVKTQLLAELSQVVGRGAAFQVVLALVLHERLEGNTPVPANLAEGNLSGLQQADEVWPGDVQHVRCLLGSEFGLLRHDLHAPALPEKVEDLREHDRCCARDD